MKKLLLPVVVIVVILITFLLSLLLFSGRLDISLLLKKPNQSSQLTTDNRQLTTVKVPEPDESSPEAGVAVPRASSETFPGSNIKSRTFDILANGDEFSVNKIIVREGDIVKINLNHRDVPAKEYNIIFPTLGLKQTFQSGQIKFLEFQAPAPGEFEFYCSVCKNNEKTKGTLVVVAK